MTIPAIYMNNFHIKIKKSGLENLPAPASYWEITANFV